MNDPESKPPLFRGLPAGLLGMLVLVVAVERYVARHALDYGNVAALNWGHAESLARKARNCDVLFMGSSLTSNGVLPRIVEERLGRPAVNLAVFGGTTPTTYFLLKRALESGVHPKVVVLDCQDDPVELKDRATFVGLWRFLRLWPEMLTLRECLDLSWTTGDANFFAAVVVAKALPSARSRFEIRRNTMTALNGPPVDRFMNFTGLLRNWRLHRGTQVLPASGQDSEPTLRLSPYPGRRDHWTFNDVSDHYSRRIMELLSERGIALFWVFPPIGPGLSAWRAKNGLDDFATRYAQAVQSQMPHVTLIDGRRSGYPARVFNDGLHLGRPGVVTFTHDLASILADYLREPSAMPKLVNLPRYRDHDRKSFASIETIYDSGEVVRFALLKKRKIIR